MICLWQANRFLDEGCECDNIPRCYPIRGRKKHIMNTFKLSPLPAELSWQNEPLDWKIEQNTLSMTAGAMTDWFTDPANGDAKGNAPSALFTPPDADFSLSAK